MKLDVVIKVLRLLPSRSEGAMTVKQILNRWEAVYAEKPNVRSVQRYVSEMSSAGLEGACLIDVIDGDGDRRYFLRLSEVSQWFMTEEVALGLMLTRQLLESAFGDLDADESRRRAEIAETVVAASERVRRLRQRMRIVRDGIGRLPADIAETSIKSTMDALAARQQLSFEYVNASGKASEKVVSPLGLVAKDGTSYLIAVRTISDRPIHYALHRMKSVWMLPRPAIERPDFDLDRYIEDSHQLSHAVDTDAPAVDLVLRVSQAALFHFRERKLTKDQTIDPDPTRDGWWQVRAKVPRSMLLVPFLVSVGGIEVLAPASLRKDVADWHREALRRYETGVAS